MQTHQSASMGTFIAVLAGLVAVGILGIPYRATPGKGLLAVTRDERLLTELIDYNREDVFILGQTEYALERMQK